MASTGIASYGSTDSETKPPLKRTMPTRFVQLFRARLSAALSFVEPTTNKRLGKCVGVYAFYDFDGEPIYVGQTTEDFGTRIGRRSAQRRGPREIIQPRICLDRASNLRRVGYSSPSPSGEPEVTMSSTSPVYEPAELAP